MCPKVWCTCRVVILLLNLPAVLHFLSPLSSRFVKIPFKREKTTWGLVNFSDYSVFVCMFCFRIFSHPYQDSLFRAAYAFRTCGPSEFVRNWSSSCKASPLCFISVTSLRFTHQKALEWRRLFIWWTCKLHVGVREWGGGVVVCHFPNLQFALTKQMGGQFK